MASAGQIECEVCGGTDFLKESGYFYCKECQTQSQEVREHVFQDENPNIQTARKIQDSKKDKKENSLTSWECYNVIIYSLTQEMIKLGANKELKPIVKCIWLRYLEKLEVLNLHCDIKPKLQLVNCKKDMNILYDIKKKKRKRKKSSSDESASTSSHPKFLKRERTRKKTALAKAEYEELSGKSTHDSSTLQNISLSSVKGSDQPLLDNSVQFNLFSIKELNKSSSSKNHVRKHKKDVELNLKCHVGYVNTSLTYRNSVKYLSPIKIYCILYLGLLIIKDKIQLGDMFRFIREGHLNFNKYTHLFPETYSNKHLNIHNNNRNGLFAHKRFRETTAKIAQFLNITPYVEVPNLIALSQRYCQEMNLPVGVFKAVENLISKTEPKLRFTIKQCKIIPNYEGRVISMIIFILKLLFGLDGLTEFHFSNFAQLINKKINSPQMFEFNKWLQYIRYRQILMNKYHLPSAQSKNSPVDSDLFLQYLKSQNIQLENDDEFRSKLIKEYKKLLTVLKDLQCDEINEVTFSPSLTPYLKYSEILIEAGLIKPEYSKDVLKYDFTNDSIDFLLFPNTYRELFTSNVCVKNGGANDNWIMEEFKTYQTVSNCKYKNNKLIPVEITKFGCDSNINEILKEPKNKAASHKFDGDYVQKQYYECRKHIFKHNAAHMKKICGQMQVTADETNSCDQYDNHYNPYERYWLYLLNGNMVILKDINNFFNDHTNTFKLIFHECSRLVEQSYKDLFEEFSTTELFLVFSANYSRINDKLDFKVKRYLNDTINYYVTQAESNW